VCTKKAKISPVPRYSPAAAPPLQIVVLIVALKGFIAVSSWQTRSLGGLWLALRGVRLAWQIWSAASNAQYDQRYKSDADEQHYERDGVVFEPRPITGKHHVTATPVDQSPQPATSIGLTKQPCQLLFFGQTDWDVS
jgi:hypothetical protein